MQQSIGLSIYLSIYLSLSVNEKEAWLLQIAFVKKKENRGTL